MIGNGRVSVTAANKNFETLASFTGVMPDEIFALKDHLAPLIAKPLRKTDAGKYETVDSVLAKCASAHWQCWVAHSDKIDCVFVTYISQFPTGYRSFVIYLVGGSNIDDWIAGAWETFKAYAKENGCGEVVGMGRKGWLRALEKVEGRPLDVHIRFSVEI